METKHFVMLPNAHDCAIFSFPFLTPLIKGEGVPEHLSGISLLQLPAEQALQL